MTGVFRSDQCSPNKNPEECAALNLRKTSGRNGVTMLVLSNGGAGVNRMPGMEGSSKKQTPPGKPADMQTWTR
jgi:hypothetical protein